MKTHAKCIMPLSSRLLLLPLLFLGLSLTVRAAEAETAVRAGEKVLEDYAKRLENASRDLVQARARIQAEKLPLVQARRAIEERIVKAQAELSALELRGEKSENLRKGMLRDYESLRKNLGYLDTLAEENLKAFRGGALSPGEGDEKVKRLDAIQRKLEASDGVPDGLAGVAMAEFLLDQVRSGLGGRGQRGSALVGTERRVEEGHFYILGPETYFVSKTPEKSGVVRRVEGAPLPLVHTLKGWDAAEQAKLASGDWSRVPADASGGKALLLRETTGSTWDHIRKGGLVAFVIIAVGLVSFGMIVMKVRDLGSMAVATPEQVKGLLNQLEDGASVEDLRKKVKGMGNTCQELFLVGLDNLSAPKEQLEERLLAVLMSQRLRFERRLPLLAVIATAAPLLGLLGTVMGMVKTFALITVFGTGNAGKLASGISEVLVATELGLMVAIPTLIAHGFLGQRIQKNLSLLERYAFEFVTAAQVRVGGSEAVEAGSA